MENIKILNIGYEECRPDKRPIHHVSLDNKLHFVISGRGTFNGQEVRAGQMFLCRAQSLMHYVPDPDDPWVYFWINSIGPQADQLLSECGFDHADVLDFTLTPQLRQLLEMSAFSTNEQFCRGIFIAVTGLIIGGRYEHQLSAPERHIAAAIARIDAAEGRISPSELAQTLNLSRGYLRNIFVRLKGITVMDYIVNRRMSRAAELLIQTDYPISIIADTVGYGDQFQFTKCFRQIYGRTPSGYRRFMSNSGKKFDETAEEKRQK
ncbi:MAG: helix-turn-helix domain-containing protein [Clostridia bacterium]|nr:helix-turn-helix domain-containing protein [Clostridia bacterium]